MTNTENHQEEAIIFDGDDTLWQTQVLYDEAKEKFYELMKTQGFDREATHDKLAEIDMANVGKLGFSKHRFPQSMREVYEYFCKENAQLVDPTVLEKVGRIGYSVFRRKPKLMKGAKEVLGRLKQAYRLYLYTGGDPEVQMKKIKDLGMTKYFEAIYIRERKNEVELQNIIDTHGLNIERTWMVGNSLRSDINPALRLGLKCVWLRSLSWAYDHEDPVAHRVPQVDSLWELPSLLASSTRSQANGG